MAKRIKHRRVGKCTSVHNQALLETETSLLGNWIKEKKKLCSMSSKLRGTVRCCVFLSNTKTGENGWEEHCGMKQMGWWLNAVVTPIQQPSDGGLKTPLPDDQLIRLSIWPSMLYKSTPDPYSTFQHPLIDFMCIALPPRQSVTDRQFNSWKTVSLLNLRCI